MREKKNFIKLALYLLLLAFNYSHANEKCDALLYQYGRDKLLFHENNICIFHFSQGDKDSLYGSWDDSEINLKNIISHSYFENSWDLESVLGEDNALTISFIFHSNTYSLSLNKNGFLGAEINASIENDNSNEEIFKYFTINFDREKYLEVFKDVESSSDFDIFSSKYYVLGRKTENETFKISSEKDFLRRNYTDKKSKVYVVKGDAVQLLDFHDNSIQVLYKGVSGKEYKGWIYSSDILF
ncbi:hypothetical protein ACKC9G_12920 [Pokkaliibacter sp. CJK22405]|uniref:hypothetical protein n=1 Tax=Pokkaliibacter sp. CJK22405 TaxID=3384615 RepID=UPI003984D71D